MLFICYHRDMKTYRQAAQEVDAWRQANQAERAMIRPLLAAFYQEMDAFADFVIARRPERA